MHKLNKRTNCGGYILCLTYYSICIQSSTDLFTIAHNLCSTNSSTHSTRGRIISTYIWVLQHNQGNCNFSYFILFYPPFWNYFLFHFLYFFVIIQYQIFFIHFLIQGHPFICPLSHYLFTIIWHVTYQFLLICFPFQFI